MKLTKAIEILTESLQTHDSTRFQDFLAAQKLGIEASRRLQDGRDAGDPRALVPLPGETEETKNDYRQDLAGV